MWIQKIEPQKTRASQWHQALKWVRAPSGPMSGFQNTNASKSITMASTSANASIKLHWHCHQAHLRLKISLDGNCLGTCVLDPRHFLAERKASDLLLGGGVQGKGHPRLLNLRHPNWMCRGPLGLMQCYAQLLVSQQHIVVFLKKLDLCWPPSHSSIPRHQSLGTSWDLSWGSTWHSNTIHMSTSKRFVMSCICLRQLNW